MSNTTFCARCGTKLKPENQFCPKCGAEVGQLTAPPQPVQPTPTSTQSSNKLWGIDKRFFIIALIVLVLILPVFPRDKTIYVDGQTLTTQTFQSVSYVTSYQPYSTATQRTIDVYTGTIQYVNQQYYSAYQQYYRYCYIYAGHIYCSYTYWPTYGSYIGTITVDTGQKVVKVDRTQESGGLFTLTLYRYDGTSAGSYSHVYSDNLAQTGSAAIQETVTGTNTITNQFTVPQTTISSVPCQQCVPQHITERVSILQIIFGF